jgi:hypothetical protein
MNKIVNADGKEKVRRFFCPVATAAVAMMVSSVLCRMARARVFRLDYSIACCAIPVEKR